ncbi:hypothetical protein ACSI5N_25565 (plasmid) [Raoultella ornithinolytica]|uniref:hypothetical protein n=1 Tax=Raoultella ornithinolytica TaxID=54291 RepID=UPI00292AEFC4|nr:hypothetical protein [Raoultella ornithinolytica]MDV1094995.1 hypothetical protein [Raoultella ornithinolytica]MDV1122661.1 hypothetical protein [Raoultella ornithinolytica]MDV1893176.1 hypothetical protein [Raoultella ornithinolytica]
MKRAHQFDQIKLISAITDEMNRQCPGFPADDRVNVIFDAATSIVNAYSREPVVASQGMGLNAWLASDDTGASSRFMAGILSERQPLGHHGDYPRDADDLGRCIRLLEAAPELVGNFDRLKHCGPYWQLVTINWKRWEALYRDENYAELYDEMHLAYGCVSF